MILVQSDDWKSQHLGDVRPVYFWCIMCVVFFPQ